MSTMQACHGHNEACCNIPPVVTSGYKPKGSYSEYDGLKTYVTGPDDATKGIVVIYDIFGYFDQTIQGADILATSDDTKYKVFMPDWFKGEPCPIEWYPPDNDEKKKNLGAFFGKNPPQGVAEKLPAFVKTLSAKHANIKSWGIIGYCWGGKVVSLITSNAETNPFSVAAECHPAMVDPEEAKGIKVPLIMLASKEEPDDKVKEFEQNLSVPKHVETFKDQIHGWMAARADLKDERVKSEYIRGYKTVLEFFGKNWK
ncbi:Alpha/Beta hydrolase protein [Neurospora tetraspora]|uniref:Alpha/Beta hydrolase protein n=1 Tax=Neurospora tetraspora TaxID=94610 RepID=A0AAE0MW89_9PEZI|nr:Alpha/Beta hydrolase protein [Neurospora tetraspora]